MNLALEAQGAGSWFPFHLEVDFTGRRKDGGVFQDALSGVAMREPTKG